MVATFDREVQFYIAYLEYIEPLRRAGLAFCYPGVSGRSKTIHSRDGFDIALTRQLVAENTSVVCNDFDLRGDERILVRLGLKSGRKDDVRPRLGCNNLHYLREHRLSGSGH